MPDVLFVDMKAESDRLYSGYLHEAIVLSLGGLVAIIGLAARGFSFAPARAAHHRTAGRRGHHRHGGIGRVWASK